MQKGLIKQVLETLVINVGTASGKFTPAKHAHGEPASDDFNYNCGVGMLFYLAGHMHHDISYVLNCAAKYMFCPKLVHKHTLKWIGHYLKATSYEGDVSSYKGTAILKNKFEYYKNYLWCYPMHILSGKRTQNTSASPNIWHLSSANCSSSVWQRTDG